MSFKLKINSLITILNIEDVDGNGYYDVNDFLEMNNKDILNMNDNKKWDVVLMNPPYDNKLHEKFLNKVIDLSNIICSIQPATWLLAKTKNKNICDKINDCLVNIESIHASDYFDARLQQEMSINYINLSENKKIIYNNIEYNNIYDITVFSNDKLINEFNNIIKPLYNKENLWEHIKRVPQKLWAGKYNKEYKTKKDELNEDENSYCIRFAHFIGDSSNDGKKIDCWYSLFYNRPNVTNNMFGKYKDMIKKTIKYRGYDKQFMEYYVSFKTEQEGLNFINYIKSDFVRTCLYLIKNSVNILRGEMSYIPWFDFSNEHFNKSPKEIDDWLFKKYNISNEIRNHIEEILPDYYGIRK
jgi:hypothetical protein